MNKRLKVILQNAVYTALYVVLCIVFQPISYGAVQVRIAEALCIMPLFDEFAIISVTLGCFIANVYNGNPIDAIFGTLATFIGLYAIRFIKFDKSYVAITEKIKIDVFFIKMFPSILANAIIVPLILKYAYSENMPLILSGIYVAMGEIISIYLIGYLLNNALKKLDLPFANKELNK